MINLEVWHVKGRVFVVRILIVESSLLCILYISCEKMQRFLISGGVYSGCWYCSFVRNVGVGSTLAVVRTEEGRELFFGSVNYSFRTTLSWY